MSEHTILFDIGVIIIAATTMALVARFLRQPLLIGYVIAGIIVGPTGLGLVDNTHIIRTFAELGVAFLLFIVGLELDVSRLTEVRSVVVAAAVTEVALLFGIGFWVMYLFGYAAIPAIYVGLFVAFSSTAVLVKLLADRDDLDTLHGRIILGILLIQDVLVVFALSVLSTLNTPSVNVLVSALLKGLGLLALAVVLSKYVVGYTFRFIEDSHELVFLTALTVLFGFVGVSVESGFSTAVGGFLAGIALATFPYNMEISERARSMRDFFVTIFFVTLGMMVNLTSLATLWVEFLLLLGAVLIIKPVVVNLIVTVFRYGKRTAFTTGMSLAQVSEFSMVLALMGLKMGHIDESIFTLATTLMVVSVTLTSYIVKYQKTIYARVEHLLIELEGAQYEKEETALTDHIVLCGADIRGGRILRFLTEQEEDVVVVDYDPEIIQSLRSEDVTPIYGDIEDHHVLERANVAQARAVISTVPDPDDNRFLLNYIRQRSDETVTIVSSNNLEMALLLYEEGADYVLFPDMLAAKEAAETVAELYTDGAVLESLRQKHIEDLEHEYEEQLLDRYEPAFIQKLKKRMERLRDTG